MENLSFKIMEDGTGSGLSICYLTSSDYRFLPINSKHAELIWEISTLLSQISGIILLWFACEEDGPFPTIVNCKQIQQSSDRKGEMAPVYYKFYSEFGEFALDFVNIWNSFGGVQIYPTKREEDLESYVYAHFFSRSDEKRLSMDYENQALPSINDSKGLIANLSKILKPSFDFAKRLSDAGFREELLNPFRYEKDVKLVKKTNIYIRKNGHDEEVHLEILTSYLNLETKAKELFKKLNLKCEVTKEKKNKWA